MPETQPFPEMPIGLYHAILNSIKDPFNITDRNYRILWANRARARFHQRTPEEMIGKFCYEMFQRRSDPCEDCPVAVVFRTGKPCVMERSVILPDGSRKWGNVRNYPVFNQKGDVVYAIQIMLEMTKKKSNSLRQIRYIESLEATVREITENNIRSLSGYEDPKDGIHLTERETEVLDLIVDGFSNVEIGKILAISPQTVKTHVMNLLGKLGVKDRTQAAVWAVRHKIL